MALQYTTTSRIVLIIVILTLASTSSNTIYANIVEVQEQEQELDQDQEQEQDQEQHCEIDGLCSPVKADKVPETCQDAPKDPDGDPDCVNWASTGECLNNASYMLRKCPRSCHACPRDGLGDEYDEMMELLNGGESCSDLNDSCAHWASTGECVLNPKFMGSNCKDSCYMCWNGPIMRAGGQPEDLMKRKKIYRTLKLGKPQKIIGNDASGQQNTKEQMVAMDRYAKDEITKPTFPEKDRSLCYNSVELCSYYASKGMCRSHLVFMINTCPLACMLCHVNDQFHKCAGKRSSHSIPSVIADGGSDSEQQQTKDGSGRTIDSLFQDIRQRGSSSRAGVEGRPQQPQPHFVVSKDDAENPDDDAWVVMFDNFLTDEETDALVALGNEIGWGQSTMNEYDTRAGLPGVKILPRSSMSAHCSGRSGDIGGNDKDGQNKCTTNDAHTQVVERISKLMDIPLSYFEPMELVHYGIGDSYGAHHDYQLHDMWKPSGPRVFSIFLTLSNVSDKGGDDDDDDDEGGDGGGQIGFPGLDWTLVGPKRGQMLLWSNVLNDDPTRVDSKMVHEALPVRGGEKYGAYLWIHLYDWNDAQERGCV